MGEIITQRQDVPEWARPVSYAGLENIFKLLFNPPNPKDPNNYWKNGKLDYSGGMKTGNQPPDTPLPGRYNEVEQGSRDYIFNKAESGQPLRLSMDQRLMDLLGRGDPNAVDTMGDLADESRIFNMGGPLSGAARSAGLSAINGETQGAANQALMDAIFGQGAKSASKSASSKLGKEQDVARDASFGNFMSPNMGAARSRQLDTIQGNFLYPGSNPFLDPTADAMSRRMGNAYRYGTAPSTDAAFARAGSFGGSAHQQTKQMQQFDYGQNLSDSLNQLYAGNYDKERQNMMNAGSEALQFGNQSLENERNRQANTEQQLLEQSLQGALNERQGWRSSVENQLQRGAQTAEGQAGRDIQLMQLFPELMRSRYDDGDVGRMLGAEKRSIEDARNQAQYQNDYQDFQWPYKMLEILGGNLASFTGGQSVQSSTNPNNNSTAANATGAGMLAAGSLAQLGGKEGFGWWGN